MDDIPRNADLAGWDFIEGRGPGGSAQSNVVKFPIVPPAHVAASQAILADAGLLPIVPAADAPPSPAVVSDERGQALLVRFIAHMTGYGKPPKEPWER